MNTTEKKENIFTENQELIEIIWYLCGGLIMHAPLITLLEVMQFGTTGTIKKAILDLIKADFLKKKQVLNTNNNVLILTAFPLSQLLGIRSGDAPEIASSNKSITDSILRYEILIKHLENFRKQKQVNCKLTLAHVQKIMNGLNSTIIVPYRNINDYIDGLGEKYKDSFAENFYEELSVLQTIKKQKINALAKYNREEIAPDELRLKEDYDAIKESYNFNQQNQSMFNISNLKNSSADIEWLRIRDNRIEACMAIYENRNMDLNRICSLAAWFYLALQRYNNLPEAPELTVNVYFCNDEQQEYFETEANKKAINNFGFRECTQVIELLKTNGVRFPYCETDIEMHFINAMITDYYHIVLR